MKGASSQNLFMRFNRWRFVSVANLKTQAMCDGCIQYLIMDANCNRDSEMRSSLTETKTTTTAAAAQSCIKKSNKLCCHILVPYNERARKKVKKSSEAPTSSQYQPQR